MRTPVQIVYLGGVENSPELESIIQEKVDSLERIFSNIISCRVAIDLPHRNQRTGNQYNVTVNVRVPGKELAVNGPPSRKASILGAEVAVREAFDEVKRELKRYKQKLQRDVKILERPPHATVARLIRESPEDGYGFIITEDGREIYFHKNSVLNGKYDEMSVGDRVRFAEEMGEKGPQASTVELLSQQSQFATL